MRRDVVANSSRTPDGIVTMISMNSGTCGRVQFGNRRGTMPVGRRSTSRAPTMRTGPFSNAMFCMVCGREGWSPELSQGDVG